MIEGAGFDIHECNANEDWIHLRGTRLRTLPDFVGPDMRILMCGLNPSLRSADAGLGFAGPSNRFWAAAIDAGVTTLARDPWHAFRDHGMGMTDLVKRATVGAAELRAREYREGATRVERLVRWLEPGVICFVGLAGYRAAVDKGAQPGIQPEPFGGVHAYVMPSTSGLNARIVAESAELAAHPRSPDLILASPTHEMRGYVTQKRGGGGQASSTVRFSSVAMRSLYDCANDATPSRSSVSVTSSKSTPAAARSFMT